MIAKQESPHPPAQAQSPVLKERRKKEKGTEGRREGARKEGRRKGRKE
jgi:hypothetical protein